MPQPSQRSSEMAGLYSIPSSAQTRKSSRVLINIKALRPQPPSMGIWPIPTAYLWSATLSPPPQAIAKAFTSQAMSLPNWRPAFLTRINVGALITDAQGTIVSVNPAFTALTGYSRVEAIGQRPSFLKSGRQGEDFYMEMWATLRADGCWSGVVWNRKKNGAHYAELLNISSICAADGSVTHYVGTFSDITQVQEHEARLKHLAYYDSLTQLPNRILLGDRLRQAMARARRTRQKLAVCFLDLDNFKPVNDELGHLVGDELLVLAARRMNSCLRDSDTLARIGGDEFVLLLADLDDSHCWQGSLDRLLQSLVPAFHLEGRALQISVSIGVTLYPDDAANADDLLLHADAAMYIAKNSGGNCFHLYHHDLLSPH